MSAKTPDAREVAAGAALTAPDLWVDKYGDYLYRYALLRVRGDEKLAEDLVQETFLAALNAAKGFSGRSSEKTWLVGILKHKVVDYMRKGSRERPVEDAELAAETADPAFDPRGRWRIKPRKWTVDPRAALEQREFLQVLRQCLIDLPPRLAHAFTLRELEDLPSEEICKILNMTPTNLWVALHRARLRLKSCMQSRWLSPDKEH